MNALLSPAWLVETLVGTSLLMLLVLAVRRPVARLWGAHVAYALWAVPALRMVLPAIPGWQPLYVPVAQPLPAGGAALALMRPGDAATVMQTAAVVPEPTVDWPATLLLMWALGAALFLGIQWLRHARFVGRAVASGHALATIGRVDVVVSSLVPGPMAAGIWRRRILLPADFMTRYTPEERRLALQHEAAHHDRLDLAANFAGLLVLAAHWWNPVAHAAWRAFRADQELACDATVLAGSDGDTRAAYGLAVLKSACVATPVAACAMNHKHQLKDRIAMMKFRTPGIGRRIAGGLSVAALAAAGLIATASGAQPAPPTPPAPLAPSAPPAPPAPPKVMVFRHHAGPATPGAEGHKVTRTIVMKDGKVITDDVKGEPPHMMLLHGDGPGDTVNVVETGDGKKMVMVRRVMGVSGAKIDHAEMSEHAAARLAEVKADMRARCDKQGITMAADADIAQLATCGVDMQKQVREAMASARKAVEESKSLSATERANALKGIEQALANMRRDVVIKIEK